MTSKLLVNETYLTSKFLVSDTYHLASRGMLIVIGDITEGIPCIGARVVLGADIDVPVSGIEMLCGVRNTACRVALGFRYPDQVTLDRWLELKLAVVLVLENPPPSSRTP